MKHSNMGFEHLLSKLLKKKIGFKNKQGLTV